MPLVKIDDGVFIDNTRIDAAQIEEEYEQVDDEVEKTILISQNKLGKTGNVFLVFYQGEHSYSSKTFENDKSAEAFLNAVMKAKVHCVQCWPDDTVHK